MVAKQALPGCETAYIFLFLFCLRFITSTGTIVSFCWEGEGDNVEGFRNVSCATGKTTLGNMVSTKVIPGFKPLTNSDSASTHTMSQEGSEDQSGFYCMVFVYNETSSGSPGETVTFTKSNYTCDTEKICQGKNDYPYKYNLDGHNGLLYCCDSANNCNIPSSVKPSHDHLEQQHTCFTGDTDNIDVDFTIEICPNEDKKCVRRTTRLIQATEIEVVRQEFHCDTGNICTNSAQEKTCKSVHTQINDTDSTEVETCCCKGDQCFKPDWTPTHVNVQQRTDQTAWQRMLLIVIGVALGILVVGVAVLFIRRSMKMSKRQEKPNTTHYSTTVFRAVSTNEGGMYEEDKVQILPDS